MAWSWRRGACQADAEGFEDRAGGSLEGVLKMTEWLVRRPLTGAELASPNLPALIADFAARARPLFGFGWRALHGVRVEPRRVGR